MDQSNQLERPTTFLDHDISTQHKGRASQGIQFFIILVYVFSFWSVNSQPTQGRMLPPTTLAKAAQLEHKFTMTAGPLDAEAVEKELQQAALAAIAAQINEAAKNEVAAKVVPTIKKHKLPSDFPAAAGQHLDGQAVEDKSVHDDKSAAQKLSEQIIEQRKLGEGDTQVDAGVVLEQHLAEPGRAAHQAEVDDLTALQQASQLAGQAQAAALQAQQPQELQTGPDLTALQKEPQAAADLAAVQQEQQQQEKQKEQPAQQQQPEQHVASDLTALQQEQQLQLEQQQQQEQGVAADLIVLQREQQTQQQQQQPAQDAIVKGSLLQQQQATPGTISTDY